MKRKWIIIGTLCSALVVGSMMVGHIMSDVELPKYKVNSSSGNIEMREYLPMIIAEVEVKGERKQAINEGFRLLADYIFGNNKAQQEIAMTAPVQQHESLKIAMTAPVQQQPADGSWKISFVMPSEYSIKTLPLPNNSKVTLKEIPASQFIVIRFRGMNTDENIAKNMKQLKQHIEDNHIQTKNAPKYAFYNPPWTLPFMRRNEIMIEVK